MKNKKVFNLFGCVCLVLILGALPFMAACAKPAPAEKIVLKAVTFLPEAHLVCRGAMEVIKRINEQGKGELVMDYIGGPEAIVGFEQFEAVRTGAVDFAFVPVGYYMTQVPQGYAMLAGKLTPLEKRESGFYDYFVELHKELNVFWLGESRYTGARGFLLASSIRVDDPRTGFRGLKFRVGGKMYDPLLEALGVAKVNIAWPETYTGLERGLTDGCGGSVGDIVKWRIYEVAKYIVSPGGFYESCSANLVNLDTWNRLPKHLQDLMMDVMIEVERELPAKAAQEYEEAYQELLNNGMEPVEWSEADSMWFLDTAYGVAWAGVKETCSLESYNKLREVLRAD